MGLGRHGLLHGGVAAPAAIWAFFGFILLVELAIFFFGLFKAVKPKVVAAMGFPPADITQGFSRVYEVNIAFAAAGVTLFCFWIMSGEIYTNYPQPNIVNGTLGTPPYTTQGYGLAILVISGLIIFFSFNVFFLSFISVIFEMLFRHMLHSPTSIHLRRMLGVNALLAGLQVFLCITLAVVVYGLQWSYSSKYARNLLLGSFAFTGATYGGPIGTFVPLILPILCLIVCTCLCCLRARKASMLPGPTAMPDVVVRPAGPMGPATIVPVDPVPMLSLATM